MERAPQDPEWLDPLLRAGIEPVYLPRPSRHFDFTCVRSVFSLCRANSVDIIHCENMFVSPLLGAALASVPVRLWTKNNMDPHFAECRPPTLRERISVSTRVGCALATRTVAVSQPVADELVASGIRPERIVVQLNSRTGIVRRATPGERAEMRTRLGFVKSDVVLVAVGHAVPVKGWDLLVRAFASLAAKEANARLLLVGSFTGDHERPYAASLRKMIESAGLAGRVTMTGHANDVPAYLSAADAFVLPSRSESFAYVLIEAMEMGLPCVSARVGAAEHAIRDGVNGFIVPRNEWEPLAEKLALIVRDSELRKRFTAAVELPPDFLAPSEHGHRLCELYESLLSADSGHPDCATESMAHPTR